MDTAAKMTLFKCRGCPLSLSVALALEREGFHSFKKQKCPQGDLVKGKVLGSSPYPGFGGHVAAQSAAGLPRSIALSPLSVSSSPPVSLPLSPSRVRLSLPCTHVPQTCLPSGPWTQLRHPLYHQENHFSDWYPWHFLRGPAVLNKTVQVGTSLVVRGWDSSLTLQGSVGSTLLWKLRSHMPWCGQKKKVQFFFPFWWQCPNTTLVIPGGSVIRNLPDNCRKCKRCRFDPCIRKIP